MLSTSLPSATASHWQCTLMIVRNHRTYTTNERVNCMSTDAILWLGHSQMLHMIMVKRERTHAVQTRQSARSSTTIAMHNARTHTQTCMHAREPHIECDFIGADRWYRRDGNKQRHIHRNYIHTCSVCSFLSRSLFLSLSLYLWYSLVPKRPRLCVHQAMIIHVCACMIAFTAACDASIFLSRRFVFATIRFILQIAHPPVTRHTLTYIDMQLKQRPQ